jgi:hypothetical protein
MGVVRVEQAFTRQTKIFFAQVSGQFMIVVQLPIPISMSRENMSVRMSANLDVQEQ